MGPNYPRYPTQVNSGELPPLQAAPPIDMMYTSGTAPSYAENIRRAEGRYLAGTDVEVQDEDVQPATAQNELEYYAAMDDVQGDGIFDQPGTHPNIHPDAGIFAARFSLPGYEARQRPYALSEVRDVTTGRPIRVVPNGAVANDSSAQIAFLERGLYAPQQSLYDSTRLGPVPSESIVNWFQNPQAISGTPELNTKTVLGALAVGALAGVLLGFMSKKSR